MRAVGRAELFAVLGIGLALVGVAWWVRDGHWRRARLWPVTLALVVALGVLSRRMGMGEVLVVATLVLVPALVVGRGRPAGGKR